MVYRFAEFELRQEDFCLLRHGQRVALEPKNLSVLIQLVSRAGHLVEKNALLETVWAGTFVEENTLTRAIVILRRELGDSSRNPTFIQTIPTRGYRFIAPLQLAPPTETAQTAHPAPPTELAPPAQPAAIPTALPHPEPPASRPPVRSWLPRLALFAALVSVAAAACIRLWPSPPAHAVPAAHPALVSIAVLPIQNRTGDSSLDFVSDGMTQSLVRNLAGTQGLRVIGSSTVFHYRDRPQNPQGIGHTLGVDSVLVGQLQRLQESGRDKLVLSMELSQTADSSILFGHQYLLDLDDLRGVQADILHDTLQALSFDTSLRSPSTLAPHTANPQAYNEDLRGEAITRVDSPQAFHAAILHFRKATELDPGFDRAWSDLAQAHLFLSVYYDPPLDHVALARHAAQQALRLNPALPEAHGALGIIDLLYDWDYASAVAELEKEGATRSAMSILACTVHLLEQVGRPRAAEEEVRRMLSYDPQSEMLVSELGCTHYYEHHFDEAVSSYKSAMQLDPASPLPYLGLGRAMAELGRYREAVEVLDSFAARNGVAPPILFAESGYASARMGDRKTALRHAAALEQQSQRSYVDPFLIALVFHGLHDDRQTILWLQKAAAVHSALLVSIFSDPMWQDVQQDPPLRALVERMRARAHWLG